jgi:hypothetical protein
MAVTLKSAPRHAPIRQVNTLETGTPSRSKAAPDHAAIRHLLRRFLSIHLSGYLLAKRVYIATVTESNYHSFD